MCLFWLGEIPTHTDLSVENCSQMTLKRLRKYVGDLRYDFYDALNRIVEAKGKRQRLNAAARLADKFDQCMQTSEPFCNTLTLSTAQEFESNVGKLTAHRLVEVPPYGELLLQPGFGVAIRHPEYMLSRDLSLIYNLFRDAQDLIRSVENIPPPEWVGAAAENWQSLARGVIVTCFNLLESFVSGLARAYIMEHPNIEAPLRRKLTDTRKALKNRIIQLPPAIGAKECNLDANNPPMSVLFGSIKLRRDAIIHCEPGSQRSERGYVKESMFHDVSHEVVDQAVDSTFEIIRTIWESVHGTDGPRWLPVRKREGRFGEKNLRLNVTFPENAIGQSPG